ncbi:MAG: cytochrome B [Hirschia sp.]|nr:cytochrome B [Hirschia sp.]MBF19256.1 cytochrome B [Hirschia sp.]
MLRNHRYSAVAIGLHWALALGIIGMIALGWYMGDLPNDAPNKSGLYQLHKSIGITLLVLSIARLLWRLMNKPPEEPPMPFWQQKAASAVHILFYVVMIGLPLTGWILVSASARGLPTVLFGAIEWPHLAVFSSLSAETKRALHPILENLHGKQAWVVIVLLVLHVGAALKHQFLDKDRLIARMAPGVFGQTDGPEHKPKGALVAFGGAIGFFLVVLGLGTLGGGGASAEPAEEAKTTMSGYTANWAVDEDASTITATGMYDGAPFTIAFDDWDSQILFDASAPAGAQIRTTVDMTSARVVDSANESYVKNSLKIGDFLDTANHPTASFRATGAFVVDDGYEVTGVLKFKGIDYPVRLPFTLDITDDKAVVDASVAMNRLDMKVGVVNDKGADYVDETFNVNIHLEATHTGGN